MSNESELKFLDYDWSQSKEWQDYFGNLYPTPAQKQVLKFKKKFYKRHVDPSFNVDSMVGEPDAPTPATAPPPAAGTKGPRVLTPVLAAAHAVQIVACLLSVAFVIPFTPRVLYSYSVFAYLLGFVTQIVGERGRPQFNAQWWQPTLMSEAGQALFFCGVLVSAPRMWAGLASPALTVAMSSAVVLRDHASSLPRVLSGNAYVQKFTKGINDQRYQLMQNRANFELVYAFLVTIMIFWGGASFITAFLCWNALRFKYQVNGFTRSAFIHLDSILTGVLGHRMVPPMILAGYEKVRTMISSYATSS